MEILAQLRSNEENDKHKNKIREMRRKGATYKEIAEAFKITISSAWYCCRYTDPLRGNECCITKIRALVKLSDDRMLSDREVAKEVGCTVVYVRRIARMYDLDIIVHRERIVRNRKNTAFDRIRKAWESNRGVSAKKLAEEIGCSLSYVYSTLSYLDCIEHC